MADKSDSISKKGGISSALSASNKRVDSTRATSSSFEQEFDFETTNQSRSPIRTRFV